METCHSSPPCHSLLTFSLSVPFPFLCPLLNNANFRLFKLLLSVSHYSLFISFTSSIVPFLWTLLSLSLSFSLFLYINFIPRVHALPFSCHHLSVPLTSPFFSLPFQPVIFPVLSPWSSFLPDPLVPLPGWREHTRTPFSLWPREERTPTTRSMVAGICVPLSLLQLDK